MHKLIAVAALGLAALILAGCQSGSIDDPGSYAADPPEPLEPVLAWRENAAGELVIRVQSNGCTTKDSFQVDVTGSAAGGWAFNMALTRLHADRCRALLPQGVALSWTKDELGLPPSAAVTVLNPVRNAPPPRRRPAPPIP